MTAASSAPTSPEQLLVDADGRQAGHDGHAFTGDDQLVATAQEAVDAGMVVLVLGRLPTLAEDTTVLGRLAALCAHAPGRTRILACPAPVAEHLAHATPEHGTSAGLEETRQHPWA